MGKIKEQQEQSCLKTLIERTHTIPALIKYTDTISKASLAD